MRKHLRLGLLALGCAALTGCSVARSLTTRHLDYSQPIIPTLSGGPYNSVSNTNGPVGPLPFKIEIGGRVRSDFDRFHGGVDSAKLSYSATSQASAPTRMRLWAVMPSSAPLNTSAPALIDITVPAGETVTVTAAQATNNEQLRRMAEDILRAPEGTGAALHFQAESSDTTGQVRITELTISGRAHGSLF